MNKKGEKSKDQSKNKIRVLIVDDSALVRLILSQGLGLIQRSRLSVRLRTPTMPAIRWCEVVRM